MYASNSKNFRAHWARGISLADKEEKVAVPTKEREAMTVMTEENEKPTS
jgi:hypothetical protein